MILKNNLFEKIIDGIAKSIQLLQNSEFEEYEKSLRAVAQQCSEIGVEDISVSDRHLEMIMEAEGINEEKATTYVYNTLQSAIIDVIMGLMAIGKITLVESVESYIMKEMQKKNDN